MATAFGVTSLSLILCLTLGCVHILMAEKIVNQLGGNPSQSGQVIEESFKTIHKMDDQECIPRLLCEMAAASKKQALSEEEASILAVFSNDKAMPDKNGKSPLSLYKFAINIGSIGSEVDRCAKHFSKCPLTGKDLMTAFKTIAVKQ